LWDESTMGRVPSQISSSFSVYTNTAIEHQGQWQGVDIQALNSEYPLLGEFEVTTGKAVFEWEDNEVYLSGPLEGMAIGDEIQIGNQTYILKGFIKSQDEIAGFRYLVNPRVVMSVSAFKLSGLWQPGSRVTLRYYFTAEDPDVLNQYIAKLKSLNHAHLKISEPKDQSSWSQFGFEKIKRWHQSIVGVIVLLSVLSLWAMSQLVLQGLKEAQLMMSYFGVTRQQSHRLWIKYDFIHALIVWALLTGLGMTLAWSFNQALWPWVRLYFFLSSIYGLLLLRGYYQSMLWHVMRCVGMVLLAMLYMGIEYWALMGMSIVWVGLSLLVLGILVDLVSRVFIQSVSIDRPIWLLAKHLIRVHHRLFVNMSWIVAFILGTFLLINISVDDLEKSFVKQVPNGAPNVFLINIAASDLEGLKKILPSGTRFYPVVRARVTEVNGQNVFERKVELREDPSFNRELNMTYMAQLPDNNQVVKGSWNPEVQGFSVEQEFAGRAGIQLGDELTVSVYGNQIYGKVESLRKVSWQSMSPNFFVIAGGGLLKNQVATWMCSFYWDEAATGSVKGLLNQYKHLTVIRVDQIIEQVRFWLGRLVTFANVYVVIVFFMMVFVAGVLLRKSMRRMMNDLRLLDSLMVSKMDILYAIGVLFILTQVSAWLVLNGVFYLLYQILLSTMSGSWGHLFLSSSIIFLVFLLLGYRFIVQMISQLSQR
jgi:putative ABC transport system permease protein